MKKRLVYILTSLVISGMIWLPNLAKADEWLLRNEAPEVYHVLIMDVFNNPSMMMFHSEVAVMHYLNKSPASEPSSIIGYWRLTDENKSELPVIFIREKDEEVDYMSYVF